MKKSLLLIVSAFLLFPLAKASHVVGGDFQITMTGTAAGGANYHIKLRAYRDDVNGIPMPANITVGVYEIGTNNQVATQTLTQTSLGLVPLGDPCYTPDPNVVRIEEGIFESPVDLFIPDFAAGYYVQAQINARNSLAINVQNGGTMSWFAMIPDPALGQNSTPDFGNYPNDAYFCITGPKIFSYPITDADGDSLAYSLVQPLDAWATTNGTAPGNGAYPYYPGLNWQAPYNLADIVGGGTPMSINATTGVITAAPTAQGFFTFAVRVEEFRNGVKIGEVRRDVQYISLNCTSGNPPSFLNVVPTMNQTIQIPYNYEYCKDLIFNDLNATDTLYIEMISPIFDSGAYQATLIPDLNGDLHYYYDWNGNAWNDSVVIPPNQFDPLVNAEFNIGTVANRFCWTPGCDEVGGVFPFQVNAFSLGCDGKSQDSILFNLQVVPPPSPLGNPGTIEVVHGNNQCVNIVFQDSTIVDMLNINVTSDALLLGAEIPDLPTNYEYVSLVQAPVVTGVPNNAPNHFTVATQVCWYPECEHIGGTFGLEAALYSVDCPTAVNDTINFDFAVLPPFDSLDVIPNVITPNGDGMNDVYTLGYWNKDGERVGGTSNPCNDIVKVEIFNRWGIKVFESEDPEFAWDGKNNSGSQVPDGTYFVLLHGTYGSETVTLDQRMVTVLNK